MSTLSSELRRQLEKTVLKAREEAERGAEAVLEAYGVADAKLPGHLDEAGKVLRRKLRAHGRQVGDLRRADDSQEVEHLIHECAYEHWHRMLFARFLAENGFLIEPESGLDVDFAHCEEEAKRLGVDPWEVAAGYAQAMLIDVFRADSPVLQLRLPRETRATLTALLTGLPAQVFTASDSLGWVYQFWQAKKKEDVNKSGVKIGADELPAVTQLFTEDYMVDFLLDNTLGAWHAGRVLAANPGLAGSAGGEAELRQAVALPGVPWSYLRFVKGGDGRWTPAAGTFDGWPKAAKDLTCLDPCMGSGHFVVAMFKRLVALRMAGEGLDEAAAVAAVIRENLYGLELDPRCTQIGAFNLALAAWRRVGHCKLPAMNLACSGLAPNTREADWVAIAGDSQKLKHGMERLYRLFQKAAVLGSLINPRADEGDLLVAAFHELQPLLEKALAQETKDDTAHEMAVTARGLAKAAEILAGQFTLIATNVPYLGRRKQDDVLKDYCETHYPVALVDLATCFIERCLDFSVPSGSTALVTPQSWLFQGSYKELRRKLLSDADWNLIARLGEHGFESSQAAGAFTTMVVLSNCRPNESQIISGLDVSGQDTPSEKDSSIRSEPIAAVRQQDQLKNPDAIIVLESQRNEKLLGDFGSSSQGIMPADRCRLVRNFWELPCLSNAWDFFQGSDETSEFYNGRDQIFAYEFFKTYFSEIGGRMQGLKAFGKTGISVSKMRSLPVTIYSGKPFDGNAHAFIPNEQSLLLPLWAFFSSSDFCVAVRKVDQKIDVTTSTLGKIPFDLGHWQKVVAEKYPHGLPKPFSSDPTQWLFNGHPAGADQPLHVAVARLLGYQWPRQTGSSFPDCPALDPDGLEKHADQDGIVCFSQVRHEPPAADRLRALLADAYGAEWSHALERKLIADTGSKAASLEDWLLNDFFAQHCALFHNRPFVWHLWDGRKDGFNALVSYHRLAGPNGEGHRTLETLTHAYLGSDWITRQRDAVARAEAGADDRVAAAQELQAALKKIEAGEPPYDLFVRWKPLHQQALGWHPDINDGVRLNCRPFVLASLTRGTKGAGLFRAKFNVKWEKDRGKEPQRAKKDYPWFWTWDEQSQDFAGGTEPDGNRWNDCHYTTAFKRAVRERGTT